MCITCTFCLAWFVDFFLIKSWFRVARLSWIPTLFSSRNDISLTPELLFVVSGCVSVKYCGNMLTVSLVSLTCLLTTFDTAHWQPVRVTNYLLCQLHLSLIRCGCRSAVHWCAEGAMDHSASSTPTGSTASSKTGSTDLESGSQVAISTCILCL